MPVFGFATRSCNLYFIHGWLWYLDCKYVCSCICNKLENPSKCGQSESLWPISGITVTFSKPVERSKLPLRILAMGRGRQGFIEGFNSRAGRHLAAVNIVIDGSFAESNPDLITPYCSVSGDATIEHGMHTPETIKMMSRSLYL